MIKIWLTGKSGLNNYVIIDSDDVERVTEYPWHLHKYGYAVASINGKSITLHRFITNAPPDQFVDHINRNRLDNRKSNLRFCTFEENLSNSNPRFNKKYKGVYEEKHKKFKRFHAQATKDGKRYSFGRYHTAEEAAHAYDANIVILRGEYAYINFPNN